MKATLPYGQLREIPDCYVRIPTQDTVVRLSGFGTISTKSNFHEIRLKILPDISDSKGANYQDEPVIGRSFPIKTFSHGENRVISTKLHFVILSHNDAIENFSHLRAVQSAVYPREGVLNKPYLPPPVCQIKMGRLLSNDPLCVVLKSYNLSYPTDVAWYDQNNLFLPYKLDIDCTWEVVYANENLPGQENILRDGL